MSFWLGMLTRSWRRSRAVSLASTPMHMHESEGFPPYPSAADDEHITPRGISANLHGRSSSMQCFFQSLELWRICAQFLLKKRLLTRGSIVDPVGAQALMQETLTWTQLAEIRMNEIMDRLPPELHLGSGDMYVEHDIEQDVEQAIFATQKVYLGVLHRLISYRIVSQPCASPYDVYHA
jgi:hypothetical protein